MILVTLGTQDKSFTRLLKTIDKEIENKNIKEKVIVQRGYTKYKSDNMEMFDYCSPKKLDELMKEATIIITHGGVGSILGALKYDKPVIAAARLSRYKEHNNDHQKQIIKEFVKQGYIIELDDFNNLSSKIKQAKKFVPKKYKSNTKNMQNIVKNYINKDNHTSWYNKLRYLWNIVFIGLLIIIIYLIIK
ncbi:MAG: exopolysaccharide biosynthesis protein [Bacilli bacterium]|nr:exopolysaccharide biosynthesis protein [Bacilli bacterium]